MLISVTKQKPKILIISLTEAARILIFFENDSQELNLLPANRGFHGQLHVTLKLAPPHCAY